MEAHDGHLRDQRHRRRRFIVAANTGTNSGIDCAHERFTRVNPASRGCRLHFARIQKEKREALH
jgi:hypothetical protein